MMNKPDNPIRHAMDESFSGVYARPSLRARVLDRTKGEEKVKRKISYALVLALAAMLALSSAAIAAGLNLFEFFARHDQRYANVAADATVTDVVTFTMDGAEIWIDSAYYDGYSMSVALAMRNAHTTQEYTPSEGELTSDDSSAVSSIHAGSDPVNTQEPRVSVPGSEEKADYAAAYQAAVAAGEPYGYKTIQYYPSDHITTAEGVDIPPRSAWMDVMEGSVSCEMRNMKSPLPEEIQAQDSLTLLCDIGASETVYWFDGQQEFTATTHSTVGQISATVRRTACEQKRFTGTAEVNGAPCTIEVTVSRLDAQVHVKAQGDVFHSITHQEDWGEWQENPWEIELTDETGRIYRIEGSSEADSANELLLRYEASGKLPESLSARFYTFEYEGDQVYRTDAIPLTPAE